jgi:hypothetical protein
MVRSVQQSPRMDPPIIPELAVRPSCQRIDYPTGHDRFRQIFRDHWDRWCDLRMEAEVPADQRAFKMLRLRVSGLHNDIIILIIAL